MHEICLTIYGRQYRIVLKKDKLRRKVVNIWEIRIRKKHRKRKVALLQRQQQQVLQRKNSVAKIPSLIEEGIFVLTAPEEAALLR